MKIYIEELEDIRSRSLSSAIYRQLEEMILAGKIKPGERINESQLSTALQVSRAPIREACRQFGEAGTESKSGPTAEHSFGTLTPRKWPNFTMSERLWTPWPGNGPQRG